MLRTICAMTAAVVPAYAQAQESSSFTVRAIVPPLAEVIAARSNGAVGDWTALRSSGGLMLEMPSAFTADGQPDTRTVSVYRSDTNRFNLMVQTKDGRYATVTPTSVSHGTRLTRLDYSAQAEPLSPDAPPEAHLTLSAL